MFLCYRRTTIYMFLDFLWKTIHPKWCKYIKYIKDANSFKPLSYRNSNDIEELTPAKRDSNVLSAAKSSWEVIIYRKLFIKWN